MFNKISFHFYCRFHTKGVGRNFQAYLLRQCIGIKGNQARPTNGIDTSDAIQKNSKMADEYSSSNTFLHLPLGGEAGAGKI